MTTTTPTTPVGTTYSPARSSRGRAAVVAAVGVLAGAGIATAVVLGMGIGSPQQSTPAPAPAAHAAPVVPHRALPAIPSTPRGSGPRQRPRRPRSRRCSASWAGSTTTRARSPAR